MNFTSLTDQLSSSPLTALALVYVAGVLTSLTPCIYPMIPITVALIGEQSLTARRRLAPLALTIIYAVGLASTYAALGLFAGLSGTMFGSVSSNPWLAFLMGNLLLLAALAMLDVVPIRLPQGLMRRASEAGDAGRAGGAFVMGAMSGLVAAPCGAPVMAAVLTWVSSTRSAGWGFIYLFVFSFGMTTLLLLTGVSAGFLSRLPRAGGWMVWIKRMFAIVMLAMAEYYFVQAGKGWL